MVIKSGKATVLKSAPGVTASLTVALVGMTTSGNVVLSLAERDSLNDTRGQPDFYAVAGTDNFTIYCEDKELMADTDIYWMADTDGTGAETVTGYLEPDATADGTYPVYNDGTTVGQLASITIENGLIVAVTLVE